VTKDRRRVVVVAAVAAVLAFAAIAAGAIAFSRDRAPERLAVEGRTQRRSTGSERSTDNAASPADDAAHANSTETTVALVPLTTGVAVPNATESPRPTSRPSATPAAGPPIGPPKAGVGTTAAAGTQPTVGSTGAILTRPQSSGTRAIDKAKGCNSANDAGWTVADCGALRAGDTVLVWVIETKGEGRRALILREQTAGAWAVVLSAADDRGVTFTAVGVRGEDVSGDGRPDLVFGFHRRGADKVLAVDVVEAPGAVTVHRELAQGSARPSKAQLDTWSAAGDGTFEHAVLRVAAGAWRLASSERVDARSVPQSAV